MSKSNPLEVRFRLDANDPEQVKVGEALSKLPRGELQKYITEAVSFYITARLAYKNLTPEQISSFRCADNNPADRATNRPRDRPKRKQTNSDSSHRSGNRIRDRPDTDADSRGQAYPAINTSERSAAMEIFLQGMREFN